LKPCALAGSLCAGLLLGPAQAAPVEEPVLLQTVLDNQSLGDSIRAFPLGTSALVPLGEVCRLLNFGIAVRPGGREASGFFITEKRRFSLALERRTVVVEGRPLPLPLGQVRAVGGEIFVAAQLLEAWFPMTVTVNLKEAVLAIVPREVLPVQSARQRERALDTPGAPSPSGPAYPLVKIPYSFLDYPMVDASLSWNATQHQEDPGLLGSLALTGDALWMSNETVFARTQGTQASDTQVQNSLERTTFFRQDPAAGLLGPLHARTVMAGDIIQAPALNVAGPLSFGRGLLVDNHPTDFRTTFAHRKFTGTLADGWSVELYQNGALMGTARSRPDGLYDFPDIPLVFGLNIFRLVFHGPLGELREETHRMDIADDQPPPGTFYYQAAALKPTAADIANNLISPDAGTGTSTYTAVEYGLSRALAITGAESQVSRPAGIGAQEYTELGFRSVLPYLAIEAYGSRDRPLAGGKPGTAGEAILRTGYGYSSLTLSHGEYRDGFLKTTGDGSGGTEGLLRSDSSLALNQSFSLGSVPCGLTLSRTQEELIGQGTEIDDALTLSANWPRWNLTNVLSRTQAALQGGTPVPVQDTLTATASEGTGTLQLELGATWLQGRTTLDLWQATREFQTRDGTTIRLGVSGSDSSLRDTSFLASANRLSGRFAYGVSLQYAEAGGYNVSFTLGLSLAREPRTGHWVADASSMSGSGAVSAQAFLDRNGDGRKEPGERTEQDVRYQVGGAELVNRSKDPGTAFYLNAGNAQEQTIVLEPGSLDEPGQAPRTPGLRFIPRAGKVFQLDFPVTTLGGISSTTRVRRNGKLAPLGGVEVELVTPAGARVKVIRSAYDGYFELRDLPLGDYTLQVTAQEAIRLHLTTAPARRIHMDAAKPFQDGMDLVLDAPATPQPPEE